MGVIVGEVADEAIFPRLESGRRFYSPGCKAIRIMETEQLQNFNERLSQWVANQGFWFQVRYSMTGSGMKGRALFHLLRITFRLFVFLVVVAVGFWIYLVKRPDSVRFREALESDLKAGLSASELQLGGFQRLQGNLEVARFAAEGGKGTFFDRLEVCNLRCQMNLLDGLAGIWKPGIISVSTVYADLRAGSDDDESAAKIAEVLFNRSGTFEADAFEVADATIHWGDWGRESDVTKGSIESSAMRMQRTDSGWRITFRGGYFQQNWLRNLEIVHIEAVCDREGIVFEKAELKEGDSTVSFDGLRVIGGARPEVKGLAKIRHISLGSVLPATMDTFIEGRISGDFKVFGSLNSADGIGFDGQVVMTGQENGEEALKDSIVLRERFHILKALSDIDFSRNYNRVEFDDGSFDFKSQRGALALSNISLKAKDLFSMEGKLLVRPPTEKETQDAIASGQTLNQSPLFQREDDAAEAVDRLHPETKFTLKRAANELKKEGETNQAQEGLTLFERFRQQVLDERRLQEGELLRQSRVLRYEGMLRVSIPGDAFEMAQRLSKLYPSNPADGRIYLQVPLEGNLYELTLKQAEDIYQLRQR